VLARLPRVLGDSFFNYPGRGARFSLTSICFRVNIVELKTMKPSLDESIERDFIAYVGVSLEPGEIVIGAKEDGTPITRPFDLVSPDGSVVASIQTSCLHLKSRPGQKAYGSLYRVMGALLYLHLCTKSKARYLVISDRDMYEEITSEFVTIFKDITILFYDDIKKKP
jgi:hypothetical protein